MGTTVPHIIAYAIAYLGTCASVLACVGIVNRSLRRPFFDRWKRYVWMATLFLVGGWLIADPLLRKLGMTP